MKQWLLLFLFFFVFGLVLLVPQLLPSLFRSVVPAYCSTGIDRVDCTDARITESGVELWIQNRRASYVYEQANFDYFNLTLPGCGSVNFEQGLVQGAREQVVFRCHPGAEGDFYQADLVIDSIEGHLLTGIASRDTGTVFGRVRV